MNLLPIYYLCTLTTLHVFNISFLHTRDLLRTCFYIVLMNYPYTIQRRSVPSPPLALHTYHTYHTNHTCQTYHTYQTYRTWDNYIPYSPYPPCHIYCHTYTTPPHHTPSTTHTGGWGSFPRIEGALETVRHLWSRKWRLQYFYTRACSNLEPCGVAHET